MMIAWIAVGLAMDAVAVAAARGMSADRIRPREVALVALLFGGFQALMPVLGYFLGARLGPRVIEWDHWLVFAIFAGLGAKMLWEARGTRSQDEARNLFGLKTLLVLALATSVDAFALGITLPLLHAPLMTSAMIIGVVTAVLSALGLWLGRHFGALIGRRLEFAGGILLICLGALTLYDHL